MGSLKKLKDTLVDALGHPILKGSTVLTTGYCSSALDTIACIEKVNRKSAAVTINVKRWDSNTKQVVTEPKRILKKAYQLYVIDAQLEYNAEHYPEFVL